MNLAIVASRVGAVPDVVKSGEEGFVVTPGSASEIREAIITLHSNPALLKSFQNNSRRRTEKMYSSTVLGNNYLEMYEGVLE
jgi:glycosyltransferase involved in cell wall biosynthesis